MTLRSRMGLCGDRGAALVNRHACHPQGIRSFDCGASAAAPQKSSLIVADVHEADDSGLIELRHYLGDFYQHN